jgi:hypothetical protein
MQDPFSPGRVGRVRSGAKTEERRRSERHPFSAVAEVTEPSSKAGIAVRIADLGLHGCYADSLTVFPIGTVVRLSARHSGRHFETDAKVVYAKTGMGMGLHFEDLSHEMQSILQEWLSASKSGAPQKAEPGPEPAPAAVANASVQEAFEPRTRKEKVTLSRLIELMMHKGHLTELEGRELLQQLQQDR